MRQSAHPLVQTTQSQEQRKEELESSRKQTKLKELGKEKDDAQEYLDVIDTKLDTLKEQYSITLSEVNETENRVHKTQESISTNTQTLKEIEVSLKDMEAQSVTLEAEYDDVWQNTAKESERFMSAVKPKACLHFAFFRRNTKLLTRLEMVSAVAKDSNLERDEHQN